MIAGLFALILISGIVSAVAFLQSQDDKSKENGLNASDFDIQANDE